MPSFARTLSAAALMILRARVEVLVDAVAEAHQAEVAVLVLRQVDELLARRRRRRGSPRASRSTAWFAPPWSGPQRAQMPAAIDANRFAFELPTMRTVDVQQFCSWSAWRIEEQVQRLHEVRVELVRLARHREHHVEEVRAVRQRVAAGRRTGWPIDLLVRERRDRADLGEQARDRDVELLGVVRRRAPPGSSSTGRAPSPRGSPSGAPSTGSRRRSASCPRGSSSAA